jgi:Flp pilus assembly protein TadG
MNKILSAALHSIRSFRRSTSGNVAMIFGLALIPVLGMVGAGVDYSRAANLRARLQAAADAAAVGAIAKTSAAYTAAQSMTTDGSIASGVTAATNIFNADISGKTGFSVTAFNADVQRTGQQVTATITFTATLPTFFMQLLGTTTMTVGGTAAAANDMPTYIDFYLLLDNTPSMGIGATQADIDTMVNNTPDQCAFACHDLNNANNYYNLAKSLGVTMRIDTVRTATQQLMTMAQSSQTMPNQYRMAIYTFGTSASTAGLHQVQSLTSNLTTASQSAGSIDIMTVQGQNQNNDQDTNFDSVFPAINNVIASPGNGLSSANPQKVLFFVSDGVADEANPGCLKPTTNGTRCQEPINTSLCTTIKNRGIMIVVLYTEYYALPTNNWYNTWIAPFQSQIETNMQACASNSKLYQKVKPSDSISQTMNTLFANAVKQARLTQ